MIIDCHAHIFPDEVRAARAAWQEADAGFGTLYARPTAKLAAADDVIAAMARSGVDRTVVLGFPWRDPGRCAAHNDYLIEAARRYPDQLIGFGIVQPLGGAAAAREVERCLRAGLRGIGELGPDGQGFELANPAYLGPIA